MHPRFTILGPGAIGSIVGAHLAQAGHSVVMIARGKRARQIADEGLRIRGLVELSTPVQVTENPSELTHLGVLIVATKTPGTAAALAPLSHADLDAAFSIQNGVQKNDVLANAFGSHKTLGALADTSGELLPGGEVLFTRNVNLMIGEITGGISDRASNIADAINTAGVRSEAVPDIVSREWSKFVVWAGLMMLAVTTRTVTWKYIGDPDAALLLVRTIREMGALAKAMGVAISDRSMVPAATILSATDAEGIELLLQKAQEYREKSPEHRMSALQDLLAHRPLEVHETVGEALLKARALGIEMPYSETLYQITAAIGRIEHR